MKLSKMTSNLIGQPMFGLMAEANELERQGKKIIHFEIGDPNFDSPAEAVSAATRALADGLTHYTNSMGIQELRETIRETAEKDLGFKPDLEQILIAPANSIIDFSIRCLADPEEEIIIPDPGFPTYLSVTNYTGVKAVGIPLREENKFRMDPQEILKAITDKTRMIIINSPNNPTGSVIKKKEFLEIARMAEKENLFLLSDEVYSKIIYSDEKFFSPSIYDQCKKQTIVLGSASKTYSMSGWRVGYAIGPEFLIKKMGLLFQTIFSCLPAFTQRGTVAALKKCDDLVRERVKILRERRDILVKELNALPGLSCIAPDGAFYLFLNIKKTGLTSQEFSDTLLKAGVCVLPGNCFGKYGEGYVRLSYGSTSLEAIKEAIAKIREVLK